MRRNRELVKSDASTKLSKQAASLPFAKPHAGWTGCIGLDDGRDYRHALAGGNPVKPVCARGERRPYMVRIPINAQPIPAYTRVDRSQMISPNTGGLLYQKVPPASTIGLSIVGVDQQGSHVEGRVENVKRVGDEVVFVLADNKEIRQAQAFELGGALLNINSIIGRVVKRDKRAGLGFQESTFFPQGTPERNCWCNTGRHAGHYAGCYQADRRACTRSRRSDRSHGQRTGRCGFRWREPIGRAWHILRRQEVGSQRAIPAGAECHRT